MNEFKAGFIKFAQDECGLSANQAAHVWKRAMEYPGTDQMFNNLGQTGDSGQGDMPPQEGDPTAADPTMAQPDQQVDPEELEYLSQLFQQQQADAEIQQLKQKLGI